MSSDVISQWSTSPSSGKRSIGQGILLIDKNGGGEGASGEGDEEVFNPLALFPRVLVIRSHPRVYASHAETIIAALRISSRVCAGSCDRSCEWEVCGGGCEEYD